MTPRAKAAKTAAKAEYAQAALPPVESIKAFDADLKCRGFQFEFGKTYEAQGEIEACVNGFHACEGNPLDVWSYYGPVDADGRLSRYGAVSQSGDLYRRGEDSKVASRILSVKVELSLGEFVTRAVAWMVGAVKDATSNIQAASGAWSKLAASGAGSKLAASGAESNLAASGAESNLAASGAGSKLAASGAESNLAASGAGSKLAASGAESKLAASGAYSKLAASGEDSNLAASGEDSNLAASGAYSNLAASGAYSKLAASGAESNLAASGADSNLAASGAGSNLAASGAYSKLAASGADSVIVCSGPAAIVRAALGTHIALADYRNGKCVGFAVGCIGQDGLNPDTPYRAQDGKLVEGK